MQVDVTEDKSTAGMDGHDVSTTIDRALQELRVGNWEGSCPFANFPLGLVSWAWCAGLGMRGWECWEKGLKMEGKGEQRM